MARSSAQAAFSGTPGAPLVVGTTDFQPLELRVSGVRVLLVSTGSEESFMEGMQGFIARHPQGGTAILGRGGSDTSAAYFGALLGARRVEIWTDVPGMFSANPREVPDARLLARLDYAEVQEIAEITTTRVDPELYVPPSPGAIVRRAARLSRSAGFLAASARLAATR